MMSFAEAFARAVGDIDVNRDVDTASMLSDKESYMLHAEYVEFICDMAQDAVAEVRNPDADVEFMVRTWFAALLHIGIDIGRNMERHELPEELLK